MSFEPREYIRHILVEAEFIDAQCAELSFDAFRNDEVLRRAVARSLEIIGEASKQIPESFRDLYPGVDWRGMAGMRDRLIHNYLGVDHDLVWDVVRTHIPPLIKLMKAVLADDSQ